MTTPSHELFSDDLKWSFFGMMTVMTKREIIAKVKSLNLPDGSYVVFGGSPLTIAGIRESNDIDMLVSDEVLDQLKQKGWRMQHKGPQDTPLAYDVFEAHNHWHFSSYSPTLEQLLATATIVEGIPFASLQEVRKWKMASDNPKHRHDVELIDQYLQK